LTNNKPPEMPREAIKQLDDYLNDLILHEPRLTADDLPVEAYYGLRNMGYNIIEILEALDARSSGLEQIKSKRD